MDEGERMARASMSTSAQSMPSSSPVPQLGEDGNVVTNISNVTNIVAGRVGNLFGKGIGGLSSKLGGGGWF